MVEAWSLPDVGGLAMQAEQLNDQLPQVVQVWLLFPCYTHAQSPSIDSTDTKKRNNSKWNAKSNRQNTVKEMK
jgi:hypothetical protein